MTFTCSGDRARERRERREREEREEREKRERGRERYRARGSERGSSRRPDPAINYSVSAFERKGVNSHRFQDFYPQAGLGPESGLDCSTCVIFARQRTSFPAVSAEES